MLAIFFHKAPDHPGTAAAGLLSAVLGLGLFLDGLRLSIMPLAMQVRSWPARCCWSLQLFCHCKGLVPPLQQTSQCRRQHYRQACTSQRSVLV